MIGEPILGLRITIDRVSQAVNNCLMISLEGLGKDLLLDAFQRPLSLAADLGTYAVVVEAKNDSAALFYKKYGFVSLLDDPFHLYLPMGTIKKIPG